MRFTRELGEFASPVSADDLRKGGTYFFVHFVDDHLNVPSLEPVVYVGRGIRQDPDKVHFQDADSFFRGVRVGEAASESDAFLYSGSADELGHVFDFEGALEELLRCSLRRGDGADAVLPQRSDSRVPVMSDAQIAIEAMDLLLRPSATVPGSRVGEWAATDDPDVLSVVYEAVANAHGRIDGGLSPDVYFNLVTRLFSRLLAGRGHSAYALDRYDAARVYAAFLLECARAPLPPSSVDLLRACVHDLELVYRAGDASQRRCIVDGILEHVFSDDVVRRAFSEWAQDPLLKVAHAEAAQWDEG